MPNDERVDALENKLKTLQLYYAAALADSTVRYGNEGILDKITAQKKAEQTAGGAGLAARFGVAEPKHAFEKIRDAYGCADWVCTETGSGFEAVASKCTLCAIARQMGRFSPCQIHCLSPIEAMVKGVSPDAEFVVAGTLWDSGACKVTVRTK